MRVAPRRAARKTSVRRGSVCGEVALRHYIRVNLHFVRTHYVHTSEIYSDYIKKDVTTDDCLRVEDDLQHYESESSGGRVASPERIGGELSLGLPPTPARRQFPDHWHCQGGNF